MEQHQIKNLIHQVSQMNKLYTEIDSLSGEQFNVFRIIKVTTDEQRVHSNFLAELLNPKGSHGQGAIFLKLFAEQMECNFFDWQTGAVCIEKHIGYKNEDSTTGGRIDILLVDAKRNCIAIENKIYAGDQEKQILRYYNYCSGSNYNNFRLFYLTLDGREAAGYSTRDNKSEISLKEGEHYFSISYVSHIINWLEACRKEAAVLPLLREGISQYINLLKILTNQSTNNKMKDEIINFLTLSPENLRAANTIEFYAKSAKHKIQWIFWKKLKEKLETVGLKLIPDDNKNATSTKTYDYYHNNKNTYPGLWIKIYEKENITIHWGVEIDQKLYTGFTIEKNGIGGVSNNPDFQNYRTLVAETDGSFVLTSAYWLGWKYVDPILDFRSFNTDAVYDLAKPKWLDEITSKITEEALIDINKLKELLETVNH